ncbi:MAG: transposase, partial [Anaerolineae bacterium]|nr:transposase [Anaerolineae bacterium]
PAAGEGWGGGLSTLSTEFAPKSEHTQIFPKRWEHFSLGAALLLLGLDCQLQAPNCRLWQSGRSSQKTRPRTEIHPNVNWLAAYAGSALDPTTLVPLLEKLHEQQGFFPPKVAADQIYGNGKIRAEVAEVSQGQTQLIALVPDYEKRTDRFVPADFTLSEDGFSLTCPNDVTSTKIYFLPDKDGYEFRFTHKMCRGCPFWLSAEQLAARPDQPYCRTPDCKPKSHRQVFISFYRDETLAAIEYNRTDQFKLEMKQRPLIERIIFNLTHFFGARYARSTGLPKANFQLSMAAACFNLRQLIRLPRRPSPVAA